mmetsp:Transcript_37262/g.90459  ORF Transcript_37262/g.90459 Transcript_37262/m.90459 type:complete len:205 (-) Transcript_37262:1204-1818(-)
MTPTIINMIITGIAAVIATSLVGDQLPIANPKDPAPKVINEKLVVNASQLMRSPVQCFNEVVKTAANATSSGSSAIDLLNRYSRLLYRCRSCSRITTGFSLAKRFTVFIMDIIDILTTAKVNNATRSATDLDVKSPLCILWNIFEKRYAFPTDASKRIAFTFTSRIFCRIDLNNKSPKRWTIRTDLDKIFVFVAWPSDSSMCGC